MDTNENPAYVKPLHESVIEVAKTVGYEVGIAKQMRIADQCGGLVVVMKISLDLFAAQLHAAVSNGLAPAYLYDHFVENFGGNAGVFVGGTSE